MTLLHKKLPPPDAHVNTDAKTLYKFVLTILFVTSLLSAVVGQALLTIGMISPTGIPVSELAYKKQRVGIYNVTYKPEEKGDHILTIRWGSDDVPGSPFNISVG